MKIDTRVYSLSASRSGPRSSSGGGTLTIIVISPSAGAMIRLSPRGVVLVERLLTDGGGPLYSRAVEDRLRHDLDEAYAALEAAR